MTYNDIPWPPVGTVADIESKSPMKYAVSYKLVDEDGLIIEDTDYFIDKEEAWDRLEELNDMSGLEGMITIRSL
jgi:hypothetical protein